jgi:hypothetical protein
MYLMNEIKGIKIKKIRTKKGRFPMKIVSPVDGETQRMLPIDGVQIFTFPGVFLLTSIKKSAIVNPCHVMECILRMKSKALKLKRSGQRKEDFL